MNSPLPSNSLLLQRLRTWPVGEIGKQAADEIERLRNLLWRIQPILNPGSEIAFKVEHEIGSVHTNREGAHSTPEPLIEPAAEQSAANSGPCVSREAAQSGTTAGSSLPPANEPAVEDGDHLERFTAYVVKEIPPGTIISNPQWWAKRLLAAAIVTAPEAPALPPPADQLAQELRDWYDAEWINDNKLNQHQAALLMAAVRRLTGLVPGERHAEKQ